MGKTPALVLSPASPLSTRGVFPGQGPSAKVSTFSLSVRKSSCLKCAKPNPGPPVVSISTTRLTPSASGFAQAVLGCGRMGGFAGTTAVTSTSSGIGTGLAEAVAADRSAGGAVTGAATAKSARRKGVQNHTATVAITVSRPGDQRHSPGRRLAALMDINNAPQPAANRGI